MKTPDQKHPQAISQKAASEVAATVRRLIKAGDPQSAWEHLNNLHPADVASILTSLPRASRDSLINVMSPETAAWILQQLNPLIAGRVAARIGTSVLSTVVHQLRPREALTLLQRIPVFRAREVVEELPHETVDEALLGQPDTAGELMITQFPSVHSRGSAQDAMDVLRDQGELRRKFTAVFVTDENGLLTGQIPLVELAVAQPGAPISTISEPIVATVTVDTPSAECARLRRHYNLTQLPVVEDDKLVGVIPIESLLSAVVEEDTRQMLQVANVSGEAVDGPISASIRTRLPWLTVNLATTFLAAATVSLFESTLAQVVVLAAFLPVVAGQGGIGGTQTLTLIVRAIALGELVGVVAWRLLVREALLGLFHGVFLAILVAAIAMVWQQNSGLALVLAVAMLGNMIIAGTVGAGIPLLLRRVGIDPAVASAVMVTTITDVFGFLLFLGIASAAIGLIQ